MTSQLEFEKVMQSLIEATKSASEVTGVPPQFLVIAMLAALRHDNKETPSDPVEPPHDDDGTGLMPTSDRFESFLKLIERDNPQLHRKLRGLD